MEYDWPFILGIISGFVFGIGLIVIFKLFFMD